MLPPLAPLSSPPIPGILKFMANRRILFAAAALLLASSAVTASAQQMAITFDDLPAHGKKTSRHHSPRDRQLDPRHVQA